MNVLKSDAFPSIANGSFICDTTEVRLQMKALFPILVTELGMVMDVRLEYWKAYSPMNFKLLGMFMEVRL